MPSAVQKIKTAIQNSALPTAFTPADVNKKLNIDWAGTFLPKHRVGNPGGNTELFRRLGPAETKPARYRMK
jgi:hypothetical protein